MLDHSIIVHHHWLRHKRSNRLDRRGELLCWCLWELLHGHLCEMLHGEVAHHQRVHLLLLDALLQ